MAFDSRAYRVLIASPSDVEEEREIAVRVIQEWNDRNAHDRNVVLLPLRWETHSAPEYGTRPQEVINRSVVDQCDLLVGIFWTRIGTPTGAFPSGTLEEIARVGKAGKPIMLYFSNVGADPNTLDLVQLERLQAFKRQTYPNALTQSYKSHIEFRDKLTRQLDLKVREIQRADKSGEPAPLVMAIAADDLKSLDGPQASRVIDIPDILEPAVTGVDESQRAKKRALVEAHVERAATVPITLVLQNKGASGLRNLYVEMEIHAPSHVAVAEYDPRKQHSVDWSVPSWKYLTMPTANMSLYPLLDPQPTGRGSAYMDEVLQKTEGGWVLYFEWAALQPQRARIAPATLYFTTRADAQIAFTATVFADSFPAPVTLSASLEISVRKRTLRLEDLSPASDTKNSA